MSDPTPPAVSDALREAVAREIAEWINMTPGTRGGCLTAYLSRPSGTIASEIARLTGERDAETAVLTAECKVYRGLAEKYASAASAAEAETARLRAERDAAQADAAAAHGNAEHNYHRLIVAEAERDEALRLQAKFMSDGLKALAWAGELEAEKNDLLAQHVIENDRMHAAELKANGFLTIILSDDAKALAEYEWDRANKLAEDNLRLTKEWGDARKTNRDLHRRAQKAEAFRQRNQGFKFILSRWRKDKQTLRAVRADAVELREALRGVIRVADRKTAEFDRARAALSSQEQANV